MVIELIDFIFGELPMHQAIAIGLFIGVFIMAIILIVSDFSRWLEKRGKRNREEEQ